MQVGRIKGKYSENENRFQNTFTFLLILKLKNDKSFILLYIALYCILHTHSFEINKVQNPIMLLTLLLRLRFSFSVSVLEVKFRVLIHLGTKA